MLVTLLGIITLINPTQSANAETPMLVTLFGIIVELDPRTKVFVDVSIIALQSFLLSKTGLSSSTIILVNSPQFSNTSLLILATLLGILTTAKLLQSRNAP